MAEDAPGDVPRLEGPQLSSIFLVRSLLAFGASIWPFEPGKYVQF